VLAKPGAKLVPMGDRGTLAVAPDGTAAIALTAPRAPAGKTYEAWVIRDGAAQRAGLFSGSTVLRIQRPVRPGSVVAVTLERSGGVDQPTSKPLAASKAVS
jgi:anti-sigma-K factor RskA